MKRGYRFLFLFLLISTLLVGISAAFSLPDLLNNLFGNDKSSSYSGFRTFPWSVF